MNSILKKIRQSDAFNKENRNSYTKAVLLMSLFTFIFLGAEFLYVDMISRIVSGNQSVSAQNYALGISVIGFVLYPLFCRVCKGKLQSAVTMCASILSVVCLFVICCHSTYMLTMCMGLLNNGERPKYYVENSHPAIIDSATFGRVQEELARRSGKRKVKQKGTTTEQGKYSSKYALTELLVCGECKTPYRRCTWTAGGKKKIVWRCINRLDYGKKYCHNSPTIEESILQKAVMTAIMETANQNTEVLRTLKLHIGMGLEGERSEDNSIDLQVRIAEIDAEFRKMLDRVSSETVEAFDEETATRLMNEKSRLQQKLDNIADAEQRRENAKSRLDDIYTILDGIKNRPMEYDDQIVRQLLEFIVVDSKEQVTVIFKGGLKSVQPLTE